MLIGSPRPVALRLLGLLVPPIPFCLSSGIAPEPAAYHPAGTGQCREEHEWDQAGSDRVRVGNQGDPDEDSHHRDGDGKHAQHGPEQTHAILHMDRWPRA